MKLLSNITEECTTTSMHTNNPSTHPENIVDKESSQEYAASTDVVQVQQLHSIKGKGQPKQVICYPVL